MRRVEGAEDNVAAAQRSGPGAADDPVLRGDGLPIVSDGAGGGRGAPLRHEAVRRSQQRHINAACREMAHCLRDLYLRPPMQEGVFDEADVHRVMRGAWCVVRET